MWNALAKRMNTAFPGLADSVLADNKGDLCALDKAVQRAEITNVEVLVCRTVLKSRKPATRVDSILAEWSQTWKQDAKGMLSKHIAKMVSDSAYPAL